MRYEEKQQKCQLSLVAVLIWTFGVAILICGIFYVDQDNYGQVTYFLKMFGISLIVNGILKLLIYLNPLRLKIQDVKLSYFLDFALAIVALYGTISLMSKDSKL